MRATMVFYATRSGGPTLDAAGGGGNPFASALIEVAGEDGLELRGLTDRLRDLTLRKSQGVQEVECVGEPRLPSWTFRGTASERRCALVLVVSDYADFGAPLDGAARDERRVAAMLAQHGFSVEQGVGPRRADLVAALAAFKRRSRRADVAVVYSTGHGVEVDGVVYLLPGDYPRAAGFGAAELRRHAIGVPRLAAAAAAAKQNVVFFAGCRSRVTDGRVPELDASRAR